MSFSSRRRNYLLTPHRRDGLIEWMKSMLMHSFVLDALETTGADTFSHFEMLIEEHRKIEQQCEQQSQHSQREQHSHSHSHSRLRQLVPTVGTFHTHLPLRKAFLAYNEKHKITKRRHVTISFNELRHILNLAQIMAMRNDPQQQHQGEGRRCPILKSLESTEVDEQEEGEGKEASTDHCNTNNDNDDDEDDHDDDDDDEIANLEGPFNGPKLITFDGDQTLYTDGANFESNPRLANHLYLLLKYGVAVAVVTAAGYEYNVDKYEYRLSGLLAFFEEKGLTEEECERFYLFGGECNYLLNLGPDYRLRPVKQYGPGGWYTATLNMPEAPRNWKESDVTTLLDAAERSVTNSKDDQNLRARVIRKKRSVGLVPKPHSAIPREALDEAVLRIQSEINQMNNGNGPNLPFCAFNGGRDVWVDAGNKRVGVQILQTYLGVPEVETLHIGDQFLNTGNDYAARDVCPCIWITGPEETTYILKSILRLAGVDYELTTSARGTDKNNNDITEGTALNFSEVERRTKAVQIMDVYTGEVQHRPTK